MSYTRMPCASAAKWTRFDFDVAAALADRYAALPFD